MLCVLWFSDLELDRLVESRIEIGIIEALGMTKWCIVCYMNMICLDMLEIVL